MPTSISFTLRALFFALFMAASVARGACVEIASYSDENVFIDISDSGCTTTTKISVDYIKDSEIASHIEFEFDEECKISLNGSSFTCRVNTKNPLSGATYKKFGYGMTRCDDSDVELYEYRCVKGCKGVPKMLNTFDCSAE